MFLILGAKGVIVEMIKKIKCLGKAYGRDAGGQIAVVTALVGLPLLLMAAAAVDINRAHTRNEGVRAAIDAAALAAVIPNNMTDSERYAYAQTVFDKNYFGEQQVSLNISGDRERLDIVADTQVPTMISGMLGINYVKVQEETAAVLTRSDVACIMALDPIGDRALEFSDQAVYSSPGCSVQVNSTSPFSMVSNLVTTPIASSFCTAGISQGSFAPLVKHACTPLEDPFKDLEIFKAATSCDHNSAVLVQGANTADTVLYGASEGDLGTANTGESLVEDNTVLAPGVYCKGLKIEGANVSFLPGVYHVWGNLEFTSYSSAVGDRVTFILKGEDNRLLIRDGSQVWLRAPEDGLTAGLVFWNKYLKFWPYVFGKVPASPERVIATSEVSSGGGLTIVGTAYLPDHELIISSSSPVASQSPATSFIARRIKIEGRANMQIRVDHETGGVPPMLPRSDDGARLISVNAELPDGDDD